MKFTGLFLGVTDNPMQRVEQILVFLGLIFFSVQGFAEKNKHDYATEALRGMSAYFSFIARQKDFIENLTREEKQQASLIHHLLMEYEQSRHPKGGGTLKPFPLSVQFSEDQSIFRRTPEEPIRTAVTDDDRFAPIIFNSLKLNSADVEFLDVIQILIHEIGHKLVDKKNQKAIDSLAAKIRVLLENFYRKTRASEDTYLELLSLPFEDQYVKSFGDSDLREIHLFVETPEYLKRIAYDFSRHFNEGFNFIPFTMSPEGSGNFLTNQTYNVRGIRPGPLEEPLNMELILEIQNRWMYLAPETRLIHGPIIDGQQVMIPQNKQIDLIPPRVSIVHVPVFAYVNFKGNLDFNFISFSPLKWNPPQYTKPLSITNHLIRSLTSGTVTLTLETEVSESVKSLAIEVSNDENTYSFLAVGERKNQNTFEFKIPRSRVPQNGGLLKRLMVDGSWQHPLNEIIPIFPDNNSAPRKTDHTLKAGPLSVLNGKVAIPYKRSEKITINEKPLTLQLPTNFEPAQIRLRWIKGVDIQFHNEQNPSTFLGRISTVEEELVMPENFSYESGSLSIQSFGVHSSNSVEFLQDAYFTQSDNGYRELKELLLVSKDSQMLHLVFSSNQRIYNDEFLKVPTGNCASVISE